MKQFESSWHLLQILEGCVLLEGVGELLRTHGADQIRMEAATVSGMVMSSVAIDEYQIWE